MAVTIKIDASELRTKIGKVVDGWQERTKDLSPALKVSAAEYQSAIDKTFATSGGIDGTPFPALKPATVARKKADGYSPKPLVRRGARGLQGSVFAEPTKSSVRIGAREPHALYQLFGWRHREPSKFLPIGGSPEQPTLIVTGKAGQLLDKLKTRVLKYILTGKV